jgi:hypothetical protein
MTLPGHHASAPHVHRILSDPVLLPGPFPHDRVMVPPVHLDTGESPEQRIFLSVEEALGQG